MLSERGLQIIEKLIDNNRIPITSKTLALHLGVSERSVKTYINEVSDFCSEHGMTLKRKTGTGFVADFTEEQIKQINDMKRDKKIVMSKKQRMSYIMYILLSGWDIYTLSLFSEELNVSKKIIGDDINEISKELRKYNIHINRVAGHGVFISGDEFSIRKAMKNGCTYAIGDKKVETLYDYRIHLEEEYLNLWINNFGQDNFEKAVEVIHHIEDEYHVTYTDYSFRMLAEYISIQLFRTRMGNVITESIIKDGKTLSNPEIVEKVSKLFLQLGKVQLNEYEKQYIDVLFAAAAVQLKKDRPRVISGSIFDSENNKLCDEILSYLSEILNADLTDNELLRTSLEAFLPPSFIRTQYGLEVSNPFLSDIREMYSGILATCFTLGKFYEEYTNAIPTDHEISFIALFLGGAFHRNVRNVKAILIGTSGIAAANIVARKIESRMNDVNIIAILSSGKINSLDDYDFDIILSMLPNFTYGNKVVHISPIVSREDERKIKAACFEALTHPRLENTNFNELVDTEHIMIVRKKTERDAILKEACEILFDGGYIKKEFFDDVIKRELIESTAIGNGVAIPHGMPENVIKPKVFLIQLKYPVNWEGKMVRTIFLLALNFNNIATTKAFFSDFTRIAGSEERIHAIQKCETVEEIWDLLKDELH
ncbi:MAG: BglG family transcription antiterminator [Acetivibrio ethanolgignens]